MVDIIPEQGQWVRVKSEESPVKVVWRRICQSDFYGIFFPQSMIRVSGSDRFDTKKFCLCEICELIEDLDEVHDLEKMLNETITMEEDRNG